MKRPQESSLPVQRHLNQTLSIPADPNPPAPTLSRAIKIGYWLLLLAVLALCLVYVTRANAEAANTERLFQSILTIEQADSALVEMELGNRGFLLLGQEQLRKPFEQANAIFKSRCETLVTLTAGDSIQQERLKTLKADLNRWSGLYDSLIKMRRATPNRRLTASEQATFLQCNQILGKMRSQLDEVSRDEQIKINGAIQTSSSSRREPRSPTFESLLR